MNWFFAGYVGARVGRWLGKGTLGLALAMLVAGMVVLLPLGILGVATGHPMTVIVGVFVVTLIGRVFWLRAVAAHRKSTTNQL